MLSNLFSVFKSQILQIGIMCFLFGIFIVSVPQMFVSGDLKLYSENVNINPSSNSFDVDGMRDYINYFADILEAKKQPTPGNSIFFHEMTKSKTGIVQLDLRQACAIESAALKNPNRDIFVIFASAVGAIETNALPLYIDSLLMYPNVYMRNVNLSLYSIDTPIFDWLNGHKQSESPIKFDYLSNLLPLLTMYKFGGIYLSLNAIVQRNLGELRIDFIGSDWPDGAGDGTLHLKNYSIRNKVSQQLLRKVTKSLDGFVPAGSCINRSVILDEIFEELCTTKNRLLWTREKCHGLELQPMQIFSPISMEESFLFFDATKLDDVLMLTQNSTLIHVPKSPRLKKWKEMDKNSAYKVITRMNCPQVFEDSQNFEMNLT